MPRSPSSRVQHFRVLHEDAELRVLSTLYAPNALFPPHRDDLSRITMTLGGAVAEESGRRSETIAVGDVLLKSRTAVHENRYAPGGTRQVAIEFLAEDADGALQRVLDDVWSLRRGPAALRHAAAALEAALAQDGAGVRAAANDMAAAVGAPRRRRSAPPLWLDALREDIETVGLAGVDVAARAKTAGAHPVHASRLFRDCYGASITEHAQLHAVRRALGELAAGARLSEAAVGAGFYDQSHMSRVFRRVTGRTPGAHRKLCAAAC